MQVYVSHEKIRPKALQLWLPRHLSTQSQGLMSQ